MHDNAALLDRFYQAFARRDAEAMAACYADDVVFNDAVFSDLRGEHARNMWRMLCERGKDLQIEHRDVRADDASGTAHWEAHYTFGATGRRVHNVIDARFRFRDGKIVQHDDAFSFPRWARQALGPIGWLGFLPPVHAKVRRTAMAGLHAFEARK